MTTQPHPPSDTPRTDAKVEYEGNFPHPNNRQTVAADFTRTLEKELSEAKEKLAYVESMGLRFGMMKSSDKPEPYLAHVWDKDSNYMRMFRDWSDSIGKDAKLTSLRSVAAQMAGALEFALKLADDHGGFGDEYLDKLASALTAYQALGKEKIES